MSCIVCAVLNISCGDSLTSLNTLVGVSISPILDISAHCKVPWVNDLEHTVALGLFCGTVFESFFAHSTTDQYILQKLKG